MQHNSVFEETWASGPGNQMGRDDGSAAKLASPAIVGLARMR